MLNLLVEFGLVGLLILSAAALWVILPMILKRDDNNSLLLMSLITISLCHSLVEYPLWHSFFLVPFALFMLMSEPDPQQTAQQVKPWIRITLAISACGLFSLTLFSLYHHQITLTKNMQLSPPTISVNTIEANSFKEASLLMPFMHFYNDLYKLSQKSAAPIHSEITQELLDSNTRVFHQFPSWKHALFNALYNERLGNHTIAVQRLRHTLHNNPELIPPLFEMIHGNTPMFDHLEPTVMQICVAAKAAHITNVNACPPPIAPELTHEERQKQ